jgi:HK97 family phage major capsid protein
VSVSTGATAAWTLENANIAVSEQTFAEAPLLVPKSLDALVPVSNKLLRNSEALRSVEDVIRSDLAEVMALAFDLAALAGNGVDPVPRGIVNVSGLTPPPSFGAAGRTPTYDDLIDVTQALMNANAPFTSPGWVLAPRTIGTLRKVKDLEGRYLAETGLLTFDEQGASGTLLGYPWRSTTQVPVNLTVGSSSDCTRIYFSSDWSELWIGEGINEAGGEDFEVALSGEASYTSDGGATWQSAFQRKQTLFRTSGYRDVGLRRPSLFTVVTGVRP